MRDVCRFVCAREVVDVRVWTVFTCVSVCVRVCMYVCMGQSDMSVSYLPATASGCIRRSAGVWKHVIIHALTQIVRKDDVVPDEKGDEQGLSRPLRANKNARKEADST